MILVLPSNLLLVVCRRYLRGKLDSGAGWLAYSRFVSSFAIVLTLVRETSRQRQAERSQGGYQVTMECIGSGFCVGLSWSFPVFISACVNL